MRKLLVFSAKWCSPCRAVAPLLVQLDIRVEKIDIELDRELVKQHGVRSVPTFLLFDDDKLLDTAVGLKTLEQLQTFTRQ